MQAVVRPALRAAPPSPARGSPARSGLRAARSTPELRRAFVSQTLLSRSDFERKTVVQLKEELKSRGLSTTGKNKQALLTRLLEDEHKRINASVIPPVPSLSKSPSSGPSIARAAARAASMSTSAKANAKEAALGSRGPNLMPSLLNEGYKAKVWPASIQFPDPPAEPEERPLIPFIPDKFDSHLQSHSEVHKDVPLQPQVSTTSLPSSLPGGGPEHASYHAYDGESISPEALAERKAVEAAESGLFGDFVKSLGLGPPPESKTVKQVRASMKEAYNELEQRTGVHVPSIKELLSKNGGSKANFSSSAQAGASSSKAGSGEQFKFEDRPLNQQERTGAWALGLLVAGGWALGGIFKPRSKKRPDAKHGFSEVVGETGGLGAAEAH